MGCLWVWVWCGLWVWCVQVSDLEKSTHKMDAIRQAIDPSAAANQEITHDIAPRFAFEPSRESSPQKAGKFLPLAGDKGQSLLVRRRGEALRVTVMSLPKFPCFRRHTLE
jgi:hypothetical protein